MFDKLRIMLVVLSNCKMHNIFSEMLDLGDVGPSFLQKECIPVFALQSRLHVFYACYMFLPSTSVSVGVHSRRPCIFA